ncbi:hypothetical protein BGZ58_006641 [Dissophora ornata]|nr:hypothetical protein BGZ58_006641 [Dissophora ornata]
MDPLSLPELSAAVGQYLDTKDQVSCALVCRSWNDSFTPMLWRTVLVIGTEPNTTASNIKVSKATTLVDKLQPSVAALMKNAHHIRYLHYTAGLTEDYLVRVKLPQLRRFVLTRFQILSRENGSSNSGCGVSIGGSFNRSISSSALRKRQDKPDLEVDTLGQSKISAWIVQLLHSTPLMDVMIMEEMPTTIEVLQAVRDVTPMKRLIWGNTYGDLDELHWDVFREPVSTGTDSTTRMRKIEHVCAYGWEKEIPSTTGWTSAIRTNGFNTLKTMRLYHLTGKMTELVYQIRLIKMCLGLESLVWYSGQQQTPDNNGNSARTGALHNSQCSQTLSYPSTSWSFMPDSIESLFQSSDFDDLCKAMKSYTCLRKLDLDLYALRDPELSKFISYIRARSLQRFSIRSAGSFGSLSFQSLRNGNHFATLQHFNLGDGDARSEITSAMIVEMLSSCPELTYFSVNKSVAALRIFHGSKWACTRLKTLKMHISFDEYSKKEGKQGEKRYALQRAVFERLATLVALETLEICTSHERTGNISPAADEESPGDLDWRVKSGMDYAWPLVQLRSLNIGGHQEMELIDIHWILDHWPNLKVVIGKLNGSDEKAVEYKKMFSRKGIYLRRDCR